jgi:nucleoid-associated protein YgaU
MAKITKALVPIFLSLLLLTVGCAKKPPIITSVSPSSGPSGGGTAITITGENFKEGATLTIGGKAVSISINEDGTRVTTKAPGGPPGPSKVVAMNLKAKEASVAATFTYNPMVVENTVPADGAQLPWEPRTTQVMATFSQPTQSGSESISVDGVAGTTSYDAATKTVTFTADMPMKTASTFMVTVSAKDMAGNTVKDGSYKFSFSIEEAEKVTWYTVQEGDTLQSIAARPDVYEDETKQNLILAANQDQEWTSEDGKHGSDNIVDRKKLTAGMVLYIPR